MEEVLGLGAVTAPLATSTLGPKPVLVVTPEVVSDAGRGSSLAEGPDPAAVLGAGKGLVKLGVPGTSIRAMVGFVMGEGRGRGVTVTRCKCRVCGPSSVEM